MQISVSAPFISNIYQSLLLDRIYGQQRWMLNNDDSFWTFELSLEYFIRSFRNAWVFLGKISALSRPSSWCVVSQIACAEYSANLILICLHCSFGRTMTEYERDRGYSYLEETEAKPLPTDNGSPNISYRGDRGEPLQVKQASLFKRILRWRKYLILILTPILLMPLPIAVKGTVRNRRTFVTFGSWAQSGATGTLLTPCCRIVPFICVYRLINVTTRYLICISFLLHFIVCVFPFGRIVINRHACAFMLVYTSWRTALNPQ